MSVSESLGESAPHDTLSSMSKIDAFIDDLTPEQEFKHVLTREEILDLAEKVFLFCVASTGIRLYPYQREFGLRVVQSLLLEDANEITGILSRQSGKTEVLAVVATGCMVILPKLSTMPRLKDDSRINKFKDGLWVGIFAPTFDLASIMHSRMGARMSSSRMREVAGDPDLGIEIPEGRAVLSLPNGSFADCNSASTQAAIEGKTLHLIFTDETQEISDYKIKKSIHPMGAATGATVVKIGTPWPHMCNFYEACENNRSKDLLRERGDLRNHFEYDYLEVQKHNRDTRSTFSRKSRD